MVYTGKGTQRGGTSLRASSPGFRQRKPNAQADASITTFTQPDDDSYFDLNHIPPPKPYRENPRRLDRRCFLDAAARIYVGQKWSLFGTCTLPGVASSFWPSILAILIPWSFLVPLRRTGQETAYPAFASTPLYIFLDFSLFCAVQLMGAVSIEKLFLLLAASRPQLAAMVGGTPRMRQPLCVFSVVGCGALGRCFSRGGLEMFRRG